MAAHKDRRGTTLLVILQAWILPCHGFTYTPFGLGISRAGSGVGGRQSSLPLQPALRPPQLEAAAPASRGTLLSLGMIDDGGAAPFDPFADEPQEVQPLPPGLAGDSIPLKPPPPYREDHTAGGRRFKELLARANGQPPPPPAAAKPRRVLPPQGVPNYDDDNQWEEQVIGSPDVPDPPLRQEMPGLDLGAELNNRGMAEEGGGGSSGGGSRFSRMMNQAKQNDDRQEAGMAPRASPRSPQEMAKQAARAPPVSREEKERAIKAAVERQQKLMSKSRGIDLDDPNLSGAELARRKALSRAQAESQAGGFVPSSSAADDYLNALKVDSQRKQREAQARLRGEPLPPRNEPLLSASPPIDTAAAALDEATPLPSGEGLQRFKPQKRTAATWGIKNKADQYMASLKGIQVELSDNNPYLNKQNQESSEEPPRPPPPKPPVGPQMSYSQRLKLAKNGIAAGSAAPAAVRAAAAAAPATALRSLESSEEPPRPPPPNPPVGPQMSYSQRLKLAKNGIDAGSAAPAAVRAAAAAAAPATAPRRLLEQEVPESALLGEDAAQAKVVKVMDLLTEHKTAGLVGEERVSELRKSLIDAREALGAEINGSSAAGGDASSPSATGAVAAAPPSPSPALSPPRPPQQQRRQQQPPPPPALPTPSTTSPENVDTLRRCSALLQAHVHSSLTGRDLQALVEGLAASLTIVTAQIVAATAAVGSSGSNQGAPPPADGLEQAAEDAAIPASVGGMQSVGRVLSDMGVGKKPASFMPEGVEEDGARGWTGGSLGEEEKAVASKALGYLLKHRGGKGYGRGRVKGAQVEAMVATLAEVTEIMEEEMVE